MDCAAADGPYRAHACGSARRVLARGDTRPHRRVVGETELAHLVDVLAGLRDERRLDQDVVEPPAVAGRRDHVGAVAAAVAVEGAEGVLPTAARDEVVDQEELGTVVALAVVRADAAAARAGEGLDL